MKEMEDAETAARSHFLSLKMPTLNTTHTHVMQCTKST